MHTTTQKSNRENSTVSPTQTCTHDRFIGLWSPCDYICQAELTRGFCSLRIQMLVSIISISKGNHSKNIAIHSKYQKSSSFISLFFFNRVLKLPSLLNSLSTIVSLFESLVNLLICISLTGVSLYHPIKRSIAL